MSNVLCTGKSILDRTKVLEFYVDPSNELITIAHEHSKVHQGKFFTGGVYQTGIASGSSIETLIQTSTDTVHLYIHNAVGGDSEFRVYEGTTFSAAGTSVNIYNNNRTSSNTPLTTVTSAPTITADGTQLNSSEFIPGGTGGISPGAVESVGTEQLVLAPNETYLLRLTNRSGTTATLNTRIAFYEVFIG